MDKFQKTCECYNEHTHKELQTLSNPKRLQSLSERHDIRQTFELGLFSCLTGVTGTIIWLFFEQVLIFISNFPFVFVQTSSARKLMLAAPAQISVAVLCRTLIWDDSLFPEYSIC